VYDLYYTAQITKHVKTRMCGEVLNQHNSAMIHLTNTVYLSLLKNVISQSVGFFLYNVTLQPLKFCSIRITFSENGITFCFNIPLKIAGINRRKNLTFLEGVSPLFVILPQRSDSAESPSLVSEAK
jgi:hypothetical protein